jgi:hypothetical protein
VNIEGEGERYSTWDEAVESHVGWVKRGLRRRSADARGPALQLAAHHQPRDLFLQIGDPSFEIALLAHRRAQAVQNIGRAPEFVPQDEDGVNLGDCHQGQHEGLRDVDEVGGAHVAQGPTQPIQPDWCGEIWGKAKRGRSGFSPADDKLLLAHADAHSTLPPRGPQRLSLHSQAPLFLMALLPAPPRD